MLNLENIDLITISSIKPFECIKSLNYSCSGIKFGSVKFLTHFDRDELDIPGVNLDNIHFVKINELKSSKEYSDFCLTLGRYTKNEFVLVIQYDSFVTNIEKWTDEFLKYDYIGAPWTEQQSKDWNLKNRVGNGGFSLRSRRFLDYSSLFTSCYGTHEDGFLTNWTWEYLQKYGIKFPNPQLALQFAIEQTGDDYNPVDHFGFHGNHIYPKAEEYKKTVMINNQC
jgi:hypothetical protein